MAAGSAWARLDIPAFTFSHTVELSLTKHWPGKETVRQSPNFRGPRGVPLPSNAGGRHQGCWAL